MYRQGLGDCFLLSFFTTPQPVHVLIDCGTLGTKATKVRLPDVLADVASATEGRLDLLIATHEHKDHVSGFIGSPSPFDLAGIEVEKVWVAWTEDTNDVDAKRISRHKGDLKLAVSMTAAALRDRSEVVSERMAMRETSVGMQDILSFFSDFRPDGSFAGSLAEGVDSAMRSVVERAGDRVEFLSPGRMTVHEWLPGIRVYVLGPPRDDESLRMMGDHGSKELYSMTAQSIRDLTYCAKFRAADVHLEDYRQSLSAEERQSLESRLPFDPKFRIDVKAQKECRKAYPEYYRVGESWRRVDNDWLGNGSDMAMQLDSLTNNTSLALAFEFIDDGKVLLFPGDAQVGNWLSWNRHEWSIKKGDETIKVTAKDLLSRVVLYKVGHHASHNATLKDKGLEWMESSELVALIPVDRTVAMNKTPPWRMPATALYKALLAKTNGRVLRSDTGWPRESDRPDGISKQRWKTARKQAAVAVTNLFIDCKIF